MQLRGYSIFLSAIWLRSRENLNNFLNSINFVQFLLLWSITMELHIFFSRRRSYQPVFKRNMKFSTIQNLFRMLKLGLLPIINHTDSNRVLCSIILAVKQKLWILLNQVIAYNYLIASLAFVD